MGDVADDAYRAFEQERNRRLHSKAGHHNRSRSGAHEPCPTCGKKLRGAKGLKKHLADVHGETT